MAARIIDDFAQRTTGQKEESSKGELSDREKEVLELVRRGDPNKEIALALYITENTVKYHLRNIMDKLHLRNRAAAAAYAARKGINPIPPSNE
jgi:two-component system NarL family response regulator